MTSRMTKRVFAGIVTFNPDIERLLENINSVITQVDSLIIVDNASTNQAELKLIVQKYPSLTLICNDINYGIARALNQIMEEAAKHSGEWVLTLDQDSIVSTGLIRNYLNYTDLPKIGMITCLMKDRSAGKYSAKPSKNVYSEIDRCFTSGCYTKVDAWRDVGGYDEIMFIDYVDYDMCLKIREKGYRIIRLNFDGILHELGHAKEVSFLGRKWIVYNHTSMRKYFSVRNRCYFIKKHYNYINVKKEIRNLLGFVTLTIFREPNKINNFKAMLKGWVDYRKM